MLPKTWHSIHAPITSCVLEKHDLPLLYDILNDKQLEVAQEIEQLIIKAPTESDEQFERRRSGIRDAFVTLVSITAHDGKTIHGRSRDIFSNSLMPERIRSVLFSTSNALKSLGITPSNQASLLLDFGRPPFVNMGVIPSAPTLNESNYDIEGKTEAWVTSLDVRLRNFFVERATMRGWIHRRGTYDLLLISVGLMGALWSSARLAPLVAFSNAPPIVMNGTYVYAFFLGLYLFRGLFDYTRWVFPLVEMKGARKDWAARQRAFWWFLVAGLILAALYDALKQAVL